MVIDGFDEILNTVYMAKMLYDMGKYETVAESFFDVLAYDVYYENMYGLIENIFTYHDCRYYERHGVEVHVLSDPVIADFYTLAGKYGKQHGITEEKNPYIREAEDVAGTYLNFSYCLDYKLMGHTEPKRQFHSRISVFLYQDDWVDMGMLAYGLLSVYEWFSHACTRLKEILHEKEPVSIPALGESSGDMSSIN